MEKLKEYIYIVPVNQSVQVLGFKLEQFLGLNE